MKLSLTIQTPEVPRAVPVALLSGTFEEKVAKAARLGVDGVELMTVAPGELDAAGMHACLAGEGLQAAAISSGALALTQGMTLLHAEAQVAAAARQRLVALVDFAAALGAPVVTIGGFRGRLANAPEVDGRGLLAGILREAAAYAGGLGVRLALEPLNRYESDLVNNAAQGLEFCAQVDHPAFGLLLDTYHVNIEESSWAEPFRRVMRLGKLFHVHLGDNNRLPPGCGLIDFAQIAAALREGGYAGYLSAELLAMPDPDAAAAQTAAYMRGVLGRAVHE
jgi:sugar phosphate isomerase/epimerase